MTVHFRYKVMANEFSSKTNPDEPLAYQIRLQGHLGHEWSDWFDGLAITLEEGETLLTGPVSDQAALHGLLKKVRDLGMQLIAVNRVEIGPATIPETKQVSVPNELVNIESRNGETQ